MFSIGDNIIYGSEGVYTVTEFTTSPIDKNDTRQFYVLRPVHGPVGNVIITPVGNDKVKMRAVMSREDALDLIDKIPSLPTLTVEKEKNRREVYRVALAEASPEKFVGIIKTVTERRAEMLKLKKRLSESDNDYEKKAKFCLNGELAVSLGMRFDEVDSFIEERLSTAV
ncbi:MAG: CarD family transcriptional regulator [Clostridia bacterium]|nr:CarD family transcriptional regulator [Clostridia bacterium]